MFVIIHELFNVISDNVDILGTVGMLDHPSIVVEHEIYHGILVIICTIM